MQVKIDLVQRAKQDKTWYPVYGERSEVRDHYNSLVFDLLDQKSGETKMSIHIRAYNEGIAFRYRLSRNDSIHVLKENTRFSFDKEVQCWASRRAQKLSA